jgi:hypothetical protein
MFRPEFFVHDGRSRQRAENKFGAFVGGFEQFVEHKLDVAEEAFAESGAENKAGKSELQCESAEDGAPGEELAIVRERPGDHDENDESAQANQLISHAREGTEAGGKRQKLIRARSCDKKSDATLNY